MSGLIFMAAVLVVAVLRDWRLWPALVAWAVILFAAILAPHGLRDENTNDTLLIWLLAAAFGVMMVVREFVNVRARRRVDVAR
jgi:uncharacterized membrane protein HdeD (DUF308 family)